MRTNKKKLAALAMSVVMAASTMSLSAFAEEQVTEPVTEIAAVEDADNGIELMAEANPTVNTATVMVSSDGTVTWKSTAGEAGEGGTATKVDETQATCKAPWTIYWNVKLPDGQTLTSYKQTYGTTIAHNVDGVAITGYETIVDSDCTNEGVQKPIRLCKVCGEKVLGEEEVKPAKGHTFTGNTKTTLEAGENVIIEGKADDFSQTVKLDNADVDGWYWETTWKECSACQQYIKDTTVKKDLYSQKGEFDHALVTNIQNIKKGVTVGGDPAKIKEAEIVLTNCSDDGKYTVVEYDAKNNVIATYDVTIKAHHTAGEPEAEGKTAADKALLTPIMKDGKIVEWVSKSCYKTATYVETVKCQADVCSLKNKVISEEEKVARAAGSHAKNTDAVNAVTALVDNAKGNNGYAGATAYEAFLNYANGKNAAVKYTASVECGNEGTVTIAYVCDDCKAELTSEAVTVKIGKLEHKADTPKRENVVEATCAAAGSYDLVTYCKFCGEVMNTKAVTLPKLDHTFTKTDSNSYITFVGTVVVDNDGGLKKDNPIEQGDIAGLSESFGVYANAVSKCEKCGEESVWKIYNGEKLAMTIVDVKKEANGEAGSITLKATYKKHSDGKTIENTVTVPYFSNMIAYLDRNPAKDPINGLHIDEDGVCRYYVNDEFQKDFAGIADYNGGQFFVANGVVCSKANGLNEYKGTWYYLANGQVQRGYNGLALYNGAWFYLTNGVLNTDVNGLVPYNGGTFLFSAGRLRNDVNGLWQNADGTWYFLALGQVQTQHTGVAIYDGSAFYVRNGKLAKDYKGTVVYDGATFNVVNGQLYGPVA